MHRFDRGARSAIGRHQDDVAHADVLGRQPLEHLNAILVGHAQIDQQQVGLLDRHDAQHFTAALGLERVIAFTAQQLDERATDCGVVVGDEYALPGDWAVACYPAFLAFCCPCHHNRRS